jgi:hypothetical protein
LKLPGSGSNQCGNVTNIVVPFIPFRKRKKNNYAGVISPQACIMEAETGLSDSEVLML